MMSNFEINKELRQAEISLAVATTLERLGVTSGELTYAKATRLYGDWFVNLVRTGKITPTRIGNGSKATRWFSVSGILAYRASELERASIIMKR